MDDPLTLEQRMLRGRRAAALLSDEMMREAVEAADAAIVRQWRDEKDPVQREVLWCSLHGVHGTAWQLRAIVDDGIMAKREADILANQ